MAHSVKIPKPTARPRVSREVARPQTDYLFPKVGFLSGLASVLDLFGRLPSYNYGRTEEDADQRGLYTDYYTVGQDFWGAVEAFESECSYERLPRQSRLFDHEVEQVRLFDPDEVKRVS